MGLPSGCPCNPHFSPAQTTVLHYLCARVALASLLALVSIAGAQAQQAVNDCGPILRGPGETGPFDYRTQRGALEIVERFHFTPRVEALLSGRSSTVGGDLSYLMRTSPNHHRGLLAIMRFVERSRSPQPRDMQYSIDCYFERAIRFAPDDVIVRMLFARHLGTLKNVAAAKSQLEFATTLAGDNGLTHFNIGMTYFDLGLFPEALVRAHAAREYGFPRLELEARLREKGHWSEPAPAPPASSPG